MARSQQPFAAGDDESHEDQGTTRREEDALTFLRIAASLRYSERHPIPPVVVISEVGMDQIVEQAHFGELLRMSGFREGVG